MLKFSERRMDLFIFIQIVFSTIVEHLIADSVLAYFALHRFIAVIETVWGLKFYCFAPEPALQAFEMNEFDSATA